MYLGAVKINKRNIEYSFCFISNLYLKSNQKLWFCSHFRDFFYRKQINTGMLKRDNNKYTIVTNIIIDDVTRENNG